MFSDEDSSISFLLAFFGLIVGGICGFIFSILFSFWSELSIMNSDEISWMLNHINKLELKILLPTGICALCGYLIGGTKLPRFLNDIVEGKHIAFFFTILATIMVFSITTVFPNIAYPRNPFSMGDRIFISIVSNVIFLVLFFSSSTGWKVAAVIAAIFWGIFCGGAVDLGSTMEILYCVVVFLFYITSYILAMIFGNGS